jgi:hypothetical protein
MKIKEALTTLDRVIASSIEAQARHDATNGRSPARQDPDYLRLFYAARQEKLGYQAV